MRDPVVVRQAFRLALDPGERHVKLPRVGRVRSHEPTLKLAGLLARGDARILSATVSFDGRRWQVSFGCEVSR